MRRRLLFGLGSFALAWLVTGTVSGWAQSTPTAIEIPRSAAALGGFRRSELKRPERALCAASSMPQKPSAAVYRSQSKTADSSGRVVTGVR